MRHEFEQNGFAIIPDVFSEHEISAISDEVGHIVHSEAAYLPEKNIVYEPDTHPARVRNAFHLHAYKDAFLQTAKHPTLIRALESILEKPLRLYTSQVFAKPPRVGTIVPRHQDMPYWPFEPYEMVSAWIALDDSTIENGCVRYIAGSHKLGVLPHVPSGVTGNSMKVVDDPRLADLPEYPVEVRRGSCILHHCLTVHRSEPNRSAIPRRGLVYIYMSHRVRITDPSRLSCAADFPVVSS